MAAHSEDADWRGETSVHLPDKSLEALGQPTHTRKSVYNGYHCDDVVLRLLSVAPLNSQRVAPGGSSPFLPRSCSMTPGLQMRRPPA
jgi:hypothetical protein